MGSALASAISRVSQTKIYISDHDSKKTAILNESYAYEISSNTQIAKECDFIFLAVKPNILPSVAEEIRGALKASAIIVSMAAGVSLCSLREMLGDGKKIIRIMPNTPASLGAGVILYVNEKNVTSDEEESFVGIMKGAGLIDKIDEKLIDAASAVSGCGPAFVYMFIEALADGAVQCGLPRDKALLYASETLRGAAKMVTETGKHPELLKDEVCSPGGSTIEGVHALEDGAFRATVSEAVISAYEKTKLLGKK